MLPLAKSNWNPEGKKLLIWSTEVILPGKRKAKSGPRGRNQRHTTAQRGKQTFFDSRDQCQGCRCQKINKHAKCSFPRLLYYFYHWWCHIKESNVSLRYFLFSNWGIKVLECSVGFDKWKLTYIIHYFLTSNTYKDFYIPEKALKSEIQR